MHTPVPVSPLSQEPCPKHGKRVSEDDDDDDDDDDDEIVVAPADVQSLPYEAFAQVRQADSSDN